MEPDLEFLAGRGWELTAPVDICHLDHDEPGYRKVIERGGCRYEIILCLPDAMVLEQGSYRGDYDGAETPADSRAAEWPFLAVA